MPIQTIVLSGDEAPGTNGRTFSTFQGPVLNKKGDVGFSGNLDFSDFSNNLRIWTGSAGKLELLAREGDVAPGTGGRTCELPEWFEAGILAATGNEGNFRRRT